jgi:hypothetical protein
MSKCEICRSWPVYDWAVHKIYLDGIWYTARMQVCGGAQCHDIATDRIDRGLTAALDALAKGGSNG